MLKLTRSTLCAGGYIPHAKSPYQVMTTEGPVFFRCPVVLAPQTDPRELGHPKQDATSRTHALPGGGRFSVIRESE